MPTYPATTDPVSALTRADGTTEAHSVDHGRIIGLWENVMRYGAKGDGSTDDSTAIQAAITAAATKGSHVYFPPTTTSYKINTALALSSGVHLVGAAHGVTIKAGAAIRMVTATNVSNVGVHRITLDADNLATHCVRAEGTDGVTIEDCYITNWQYGILCLSAPAHGSITKNVRILRNKFLTPANDTVYPIQITGNDAASGDPVQRVWVEHNEIVGNQGAFVSGQNKTADQIEIQNVYHFKICGNRLSYGGDLGIGIARASKWGTICHNSCSYMDTDGIRVTGQNGTCYYVVVSDNVCFNNGLDAAASGATNGGIQIVSSDSCVVSNNVCYDDQGPQKQDYGIVINAATNLTLPPTNMIANNLTGDVTLSGAWSLASSNTIHPLRLPRGTTKTIASGVITVDRGYHRVDTEGAAATDDLDTINGGSDGQFLVLASVSNARDVVCKDNTGNMQLAGDMTLANSQDTLTLFYNTALSKWVELSRSTN